jgi:murein DD-endopeptidase MepM/ murein hydrolase activator NlpD
MRFTDSPFSNPFGGTPEPVTTGSIPPVTAAPTAKVLSEPLAAPVSSAGTVALTQPSFAGAATAATAASGPAGWSAVGGTAVGLGKGETVKALSTRYGVPESAIRSANGLKPGQDFSGASQAIIPVYRASGAGAVASAAAPAASAARSSAASATATATRITAAPAKAADSAKATVRTAAATPAASLDKQKAEAEKARVAREKADTEKAAKAKAEKEKLAKAKAEKERLEKEKREAAARAKRETVAAKPDVPAATAAPASRSEPETTASVASASKDASPDFRWPARGRVIQGFGTRNGQTNEGINIAVPEGTSVRAADGGTVAYAGEELKGYGKLVLIRHSNGYVTAYAHNGELKVRKGDQVQRGQVVATSGRTGNVSTPQLHFEVRKGSNPVDPMKYLGGT